MDLIDAKEAAIRLGVNDSRIRQLIRSGRLPAQMIGNSYAINVEDLALVAERKTGRPKKEQGIEPPAETPIVAAEMKVGDVVTAPAQKKPAKKAKKAKK